LKSTIGWQSYQLSLEKEGRWHPIKKYSELVSWVVAMSFGFIIQLRVEPDAIRNVNLFFEKKAWGAFRYEIYPSYDFVAVAEKFKKEHNESV
jgi:hypothetical protein